MEEGNERDVHLFSNQITALQYLRKENTEVNEVLYGGGARGGKSYLGCIWQISRRMSMAGSVGLIGREELTKLKDTTIITFFEVLKDMNALHFFHYNAQTLTAICANGSIIFFRELKYIPSDPEFDRFGSYAITDLFIDEAQQVSAKAISVLKGRFSVLRGKNPDGSQWHTIPKALYTCNPKRNWIYSDFILPYKNDTLRNDRKFIKSLPIDNPYTDKSYIENLLKADKVTVQRLYYGNFEYDDDPSALCDYDAISDIFTNDFVTGGDKRISADLAMKGRDKFIVGLWNGLEVNIKIDKPLSDGKGIESDLKNLMIEESVPRSKTIVDADGMGAYLESYLNGIKEFHGGALPFNKDYFNLKSECGFKLAEVINKRQIKIICNKEQKQRIIEEIGVLKQYDIDNDTSKKRIISKEEMKQLLQHSPDYLDMLIMGMYFDIKPVSRGIRRMSYKI
ncbi:MAG: phage terminase large subunit [Candidatus Azobacteroides sp.]|nr:phage terminase large subunit [Candidatus Azobacteroides sp.]